MDVENETVGGDTCASWLEESEAILALVGRASVLEMAVHNSTCVGVRRGETILPSLRLGFVVLAEAGREPE